MSLASTTIREHLRDIRDTSRNRDDITSLAAFGGSPQPVITDGTEAEFRREVSRLHLQLAGVDALTQTTELVTAGTDLIERVVSQLRQTTSLDSTQRALLEQLSQFFFYTVWRYPAFAISAETATGPHANALRVEHLRAFEDFDEQFERQLNKFTHRLAETGLLPTVNESGSSNTDIGYGITFTEE